MELGWNFILCPFYFGWYFTQAMVNRYMYKREGRALELKIIIPDQFYDMEILHRKWLANYFDDWIENVRPRLLSFKRFLKQFRKKSNDSIESLWLSPLQIAEQTHILFRDHFVQKNIDAGVLFGTLNVPEEGYEMVKDENVVKLL